MMLSIVAMLLGLVFLVNVFVFGWIVTETIMSDCLHIARRVAAVAVLNPSRVWWTAAVGAGLAVAAMGMAAQAMHVRMAARERARIVLRLDMKEGLQAVKRGHFWGYLDDRGEQVIGPRFSKARSFSEGLAPVSVNARWGYIDRHGQFVIEPQYRLAGEYRNGIALVGLDDFTLGYIDAHGNLITNVDPRAARYSHADASLDEKDLDA